MKKKRAKGDIQIWDQQISCCETNKRKVTSCFLMC